MARRRANRVFSPGRYRLRRLVRKSGWYTAVAVVLAALVAADRFGAFGRAPKGDFAAYDGRRFRVVRVIDGDTLDVDAADGGKSYTRIRLWGIDTPESYRRGGDPDHFGPEATEYAKRLLRGQWVRLELEPGRRSRGKYKRLLAFVHMPDGTMLNHVLIEKGYGYADMRFDHSRKQEFARLEAAARKRQLGLWKDVKSTDPPHHVQQRLGRQ